MPNSMPPSSSMVSQRTTPTVQCALPMNLMPITSPTVIDCAALPMRRTLRPPALWFTTSHSLTLMPLETSSSGTNTSGMVMPLSIACASFAGSAFGSIATKCAMARMPAQIATEVSIGSRREVRLGGSPHRARSLPSRMIISGPMALLVVAETLPASTAWRRARSRSTIGLASSRRQLGPPGSSLADSSGFGGLSRSQGTRKCPPGLVSGLRLAERPCAALAADHLHDPVELARDEAIGVGEGDEKRFRVQVREARLRLGVRRVGGEAFLFRVQVERVDLLPRARGNRRVGAVARPQQLHQALHRPVREEGHLLLRAEGEELACLLEDQRLVAVAQLDRELAREGQRLAGLRRQRQQGLAVDGIELVEDYLRDGPVRLPDLHPVVEVDLRAVDRAEVREDPAARLGALAQRQRFDPGLDLLRAKLQVLRRGRSLGGNAEVECHSCVNL